jgi:hypothetical protein
MAQAAARAPVKACSLGVRSYPHRHLRDYWDRNLRACLPRSRCAAPNESRTSASVSCSLRASLSASRRGLLLHADAKLAARDVGPLLYLACDRALDLFRL